MWNLFCCVSFYTSLIYGVWQGKLWWNQKNALYHLISIYSGVRYNSLLEFWACFFPPVCPEKPGPTTKNVPWPEEAHDFEDPGLTECKRNVESFIKFPYHHFLVHRKTLCLWMTQINVATQDIINPTWNTWCDKCSAEDLSGAQVKITTQRSEIVRFVGMSPGTRSVSKCCEVI